MEFVTKFSLSAAIFIAAFTFNAYARALLVVSDDKAS